GFAHEKMGTGSRLSVSTGHSRFIQKQTRCVKRRMTMKKYAIITAALLLSVGCQTRQHETSSTMEPSRTDSYGTSGMGVQSGSSSSSQSSAPSSVFDSPANPRDALQDNSSALKERSDQTPANTEITPDIGAPGLDNQKGAASERSDQNDRVQQSDT